ncbi:PREDICTED: lysophospholipase-like protein 1 [Nicrophorus vespilloides]|uniref:palmitoyl-protein hydrolase n=1 Tax=Nicrophorus vespilloides TaxID=110193 RepID=A0ABM1MP68_NICVS|nr:PREDICTED: lysophospholipase-like protein 1 [Nicrophorus vespilloides]
MAGKISAMKIIKQTNKVNTASVIFFHGSGDTGPGVLEWMKFLIGDFSQPHIKFLFPSAPMRPYTPLNGAQSNVWFDRLNITPDAPEHTQTLDSIGEEVKKLIQAEVNSGVPLDKIIVGGFSMGGALALHTAYRTIPGLAGVFALSSFLNKDSLVYDVLRKNGPSKTPLYMFHGDRDTLVPNTWGLESFNNLTELGVKGEYVQLKNTLHELKKHELELLISWIRKLLPYEKAV